MLRRSLFRVVLMISSLTTATTAFSQELPTETPVVPAKVETTPGTAGTSVQVRFDAPIGVRALSVDATLKSEVSRLKAGDRVEIVSDNPKDPKKLVAVSIASVAVGTQAAFFAVFGSMAVVLGIVFVMMRASPLQLILGEDGRYSKSKAQIAFWALSVISVYLGAVVLRWTYLGGDFIGGVEIPTNLLLISGLSAFSFGAAKAITSKKVEDAIPDGTKPEDKKAEADKVKPPVTTQSETRTFLSFLDDLVRNDKGGFDLGDTQMVLITMIVVGLFLLDGVVFLQNLAFQAQVALPDVDTTLLSAFGIGQGAYLVKKAAGEPGKS